MFGLSFSCKHKWLPVDMFGYQHCEKCKIALCVGIPCKHNWEVYETSDAHRGGKYVGKLYVLRCKVCGELEDRFINTLDRVEW